MKHSKIYLILFITVPIMGMSSCSDFFEENISDKTVQVVYPSDGANISSHNISFVWTEEEGFEKYHIVVVSPSFNDIQNYICDTTLTRYKMELQLPNGDYQWSIQAENFGYKSLMNYLSFKIANNEE